MYVRWKVKPRANGYEPNGRGWNSKTKPIFLYVAYLVESKRVDGKPRQKTIYLGSIQDHQIEQVCHRTYFWQAAQKRVAKLNLTAEQILMIRAKLNERVPMPTKEELEGEARERARDMAELSAMTKGLKATM